MPKGLFGGSAPTSAPAVPPQHGAVFNTADALLGGWLGYGGKAQAAQAARAAAAADAAAYRDRVQAQFGDDPVAMIAAAANPEEFAKNLATGYGAANVEGGSTRVYGNPARGGSTFTAPKLTEDAGIYGTQSPTGFMQTGARGPSIAENETATHNRASEDAAFTPEGFLPRKDQTGKIVGFDLDPNYGGFAKEKAAAGATRVNVPITLPAQNAFAEALAKGYAGRLDTAVNNADTAQTGLSALNDALAALNGPSGAITGAGSAPRLAANKALSLIGDPTAKDKVANTETFEAVMGKQVLSIAKQLGSGSGISNADRDFAGKVAGGSIALDEGSIRRLIDIQQREAKSQVGRAQAMGREAFGAVPSSQGLPQSAFGGGVSAAPRIGATPTRRKFNPATGRIE